MGRHSLTLNSIKAARHKADSNQSIQHQARY
jgi:hypothetical protein